MSQRGQYVEVKVLVIYVIKNTSLYDNLNSMMTKKKKVVVKEEKKDGDPLRINSRALPRLHRRRVEHEHPSTGALCADMSNVSQRPTAQSEHSCA